MAQTQSIFNAPLSGNLGTHTFKNYSGKQVVTTRFTTTSAKGEGASRAQRDTRMLMPNLTLIASQIKEWLPALWENNKEYARPYGHFLAHNMSRNLPVLPKDLIADKRCCWGELQISCGTLPRIQIVQNFDNVYTSIKCNTSTSFANTQMKDFSQAIISKNPEWREGDFLVIIKASYTELSYEAPQVPYYTTPSIAWLKLDTKSTDTVISHTHGFTVNFASKSVVTFGTCLSITNSDSDSFAVVHVRKERGQYLASSQVMSWKFFGSEDIAFMLHQDYTDFCASSWGYKDKILN